MSRILNRAVCRAFLSALLSALICPAAFPAKGHAQPIAQININATNNRAPSQNRCRSACADWKNPNR